MKSDLPYLAHIADSIDAIENYVAGGRETFLAQRLIQDAVIRNFEVIGEAANRLSRRSAEIHRSHGLGSLPSAIG